MLHVGCIEEYAGNRESAAREANERFERWQQNHPAAIINTAELAFRHENPASLVAVLTFTWYDGTLHGGDE